MRIVVNRELCESNGVCVNVAPDLFVIDERDKLQILVERPSPDRIESAKTAVGRCPRSALTLVEG